MTKKNYYKKHGSLFSGENNPFNVKVNRKKHSVLGSDVKGTKGLPVASKGLNYAKRKELLKQQKTYARKSNTYVDRRAQNFEDDVTARFVSEGQRKSRKSVFNLSGDNVSTREKRFFEESKEEEEEITPKKQFGSFETQKTPKEMLADKIIESKQKKMEKKMEKEKYLNNLAQVDNAWKELFSGSSKGSNASKSKINVKEPVESNIKDPYDISKFELKFDTKRSSISLTKSAEEIAKEEEKKRIQSEKEKLLRMKDDQSSKNVKMYDHVSADALGDDFEYFQKPMAIEEDNDVVTERNNDDSDAESLDSDDSLEEMEESDPEEGGESLKEDNVLVSDIPDNLDDFKAQVEDCDDKQLNSFLDSVLKKSTKSKNRNILTKLESFFEILLQYAFELCTKKFPKFELIGILPPHLHSLANAVNMGTAERLLKFLDEEHEVFSSSKKQGLKRNFPRPQSIVLLKYVALIYSTSDFRHPVVTPAMIFMCDILGSPFRVTFPNILSRLLISENVLNCISENKRFVPDAVYFLNNILQLAAPGESKKNSPKKFDLLVSEKYPDEDIPSLDLFHSNKDLTDESKKIAVIHTVTNQLHQYATMYRELPSFREIFERTLRLASELPLDLYPLLLQVQVKELIETVREPVPLLQLSFQRAKPKPLKMFEPAYESKFNQKEDLNKKRQQIKKVSQKIKKEEKSMLREIRREAQVAQAEKLKEKLESDAARKRKVKEIYGNLAVQEGEFKKMMKKK